MERNGGVNILFFINILHVCGTLLNTNTFNEDKERLFLTLFCCVFYLPISSQYNHTWRVSLRMGFAMLFPCETTATHSEPTNLLNTLRKHAHAIGSDFQGL